MKLKYTFAALIGASALIAPSGANANPLALMSGQLSSSLMAMVQAGSLCVVYTYDMNGNRTAQTNSSVGSGTTLWGSGNYGCFMWSA